MFRHAACGLAAVLLASQANAATIDIVDPSDTGDVYASIDFDDAYDGLIEGWFVSDWDDDFAERFDMGRNSSPATESAFVASMTGEDLSLIDTFQESSDFIVDSMAFFTAKFGQSLAIFRNLSSDAIEIDWITVSGRDCPGSPNQCGGLSHVYATSAVPIPASLPLMLLGIAGLGLMRRRLT